MANVIVGVFFSPSPILHLFKDAPLLSFLGVINGDGSCNFRAKLTKVSKDYWRSVSTAPTLASYCIPNLNKQNILKLHFCKC